ncbi:hypothetical protein M409DRAFT_20165 [Zasmidium cellare ATCC 36951]|uniref:Uncharacterized protein n=1 Tax=Zasmidium cellare ATCC 36951 TaxID=1080233 RepID=A0A6A6CUA7_ZASCE|nr:uncharacterized protein M409DRAFT_20165 [Zasmidium cellare ATCC 36951]KAF2169750.1 hypothetical protein M409DRAFT_20165 [Zasmidium cellare ATCC 36951]
MTATSSTNGDAAGDENEKPLSLLDLPPEIWSDIVKMVVDEEPKIKDLCRLQGSQRPANGHQPRITQLLKTIGWQNRQHIGGLRVSDSFTPARDIDLYTYYLRQVFEWDFGFVLEQLDEPSQLSVHEDPTFKVRFLSK